MNYTDGVPLSVRFKGRCCLGIDRREEGNAVKEGQKCGRSSILARIRPHGGVNGAAWRARRVGQVSTFSPFAHPAAGRLKRAQMLQVATYRGRAGLDITSLTRHCAGRKSNGISTWRIRNAAQQGRPHHVVVGSPTRRSFSTYEHRGAHQDHIEIGNGRKQRARV